jgi:predicted Zn-dependent peptidase
MKWRRPMPSCGARKIISKGSLMLSLESTSSRMSNLARQEMYFDRQFGLDETIQAIERVRRRRRHVARELFASGSLGATVLGQQDGLELSTSS